MRTSAGYLLLFAFLLVAGCAHPTRVDVGGGKVTVVWESRAAR